ncbi:MAG: anthranilate phosphoribosyltransferase [Thermomicrobiales bacterium]|jgi:anthranilate phosphoribosyltransferase|nr:anthranilate phosphoribosyltransferase [Thermomicrobiales bacterium]
MTETGSRSRLDAREAIKTIVEGGVLTEEQAADVMDAIMQGEATPSQIASIITALRVRGETVDELTGFARALRSHVQRVAAPDDRPIVDTCGTGGDGGGTFNISTTAALVIAGAGVRVAKHGNRSVTSQSGSADVLEALGVTIDLPPDAVAASIRDAGIGFMFAPSYHPGFRHAGPTRREIGVRTVFNFLGPMTNPAGLRRQIIGVSTPAAAAMMAEALGRLGSERVLIVYSPEGLDELGLGEESHVVEFDADRGGATEYTIGPEAVGLKRANAAALAGGDAAHNAGITRRILAGERGSMRDVVLFNAGAGLYAAGVVDSIAQGVELAAATIDSGQAAEALERFVVATSQHAGGRTDA